MSFFDKLRGVSQRNRSMLCVGLDPDPARIAGGDIAGYLQGVIEATHDLVACYKPNLAFYEALGRDGMSVLARVLEAVPPEIPVLADAKRGDIGNTAEAHARALFDVWGFDGATVNPWGGRDALQPLLDRADRGIFVWCRSSNPGAADFQDLEVVADGGVPRPMYEVVAMHAREWNRHGNLGLVAGATSPEQIARLRSLCPDMPFLLPGVGAQGADTRAAVRAARNADQGGFIVNVSRQVLYASRGPDFASAARSVALRIRDDINEALRAAVGSRQ